MTNASSLEAALAPGRLRKRDHVSSPKPPRLRELQNATQLRRLVERAPVCRPVRRLLVRSPRPGARRRSTPSPAWPTRKGLGREWIRSEQPAFDRLGLENADWTQTGPHAGRGSET